MSRWYVIGAVDYNHGYMKIPKMPIHHFHGHLCP